MTNFNAKLYRKYYFEVLMNFVAILVLGIYHSKNVGVFKRLPNGFRQAILNHSFRQFVGKT
jgi:queuine/archaeosine tRNA-ribosyltransferase